MTTRRVALKLTFAAVAIALAPVSGSAQNVQADPLSFHSRYMYSGVKTLLLGSAEKMPEAGYGFRPTEDVRTFAQIIGHAADSQYTYCSMAMGEMPPAPRFEKTLSRKAELVAALKQALEFCDRAYDSLTDASAARMVKLGPTEMPKMGVLDINLIHSTEHYGNLVTYLRMNKLVPPSSEPGFNPRPVK